MTAQPANPFTTLRAAIDADTESPLVVKSAFSAGLLILESSINDLSRCAAALERMAEAQERSADAAEEIVRRSVPT
jgi:hypothetical protein